MTIKIVTDSTAEGVVGVCLIVSKQYEWGYSCLAFVAGYWLK